MGRDVESGIDELYSGPLEDFVRERDALAKDLTAAGDAEGAARVRAQRKPVVSAWALNRLARERPDALGDLIALGERLRAAQHRAISSGEVEPLRKAIEERRGTVTALARAASAILDGAGIGAGSHRDDLVSTLEAAAADEEAAGLLRSGRLVKPLRPPTAFGAQGLRVLEGGGVAEPGIAAGQRVDREGARRARELERELAAAHRRERAALASVERARRRLDDLEARRAEARDALKAAEAEHRGAAVEAKRLASALARLQRRT